VIISGTPLPPENDGELWHRWGSNPGAWDLANDVPRVSSDPNDTKDMENTDGPGGAFTGSFAALTNTLFFDVEADLEFWNNAVTEEIVVEACEAAVGVTSISNPVDGDIIIAQLRDG